MICEDFAPVLEATRDNLVESVHFGSIAVVDKNGKLVASLGNPERVIFLRSSAKPFQAIPLVEMGGADAFDFTPQEVALTCASHSGTDEHVSVLRKMQEKIGVSEADLLCGTHPPFHKPTANAMLLRGEELTQNRHNCSGKHTGMLAHARFKGYPIEEYIAFDHPVQKTILKVISEMFSTPEDQIEMGVDGCSAPVHAVPLRQAALGYARLCDPSELEPVRAEACRRITAAMMEHPNMVAGPGRFDTRLMEVTSGRIISKGGAEGYQGLGLMPGALGEGSPALGITLKIADGDLNDRVRPCVSMEVLRQLGAISEAEMCELSEFCPRPLTNWRKIPIGELRPAFKLNLGNQ